MSDQEDWNHSHKCTKCGHVWRHELASPNYHEAHDCPNGCGVNVREVLGWKDAEAERAWHVRQGRILFEDAIDRLLSGSV